MKRLLSIGTGLFVFSLLNIFGWLLIGITLGQPEISNVFSLTYPLQCLNFVFISIFATGANIKAVKQKNKNPIYSNLIFGAIIGIVFYGLIAIFIEPYINFMQMDVATYKIFALYSVGEIFLQLVLAMVVEKLNFEEKEKRGSLFNIIFNVLNVGSLIITSLISKNHIIVVSIPLALTAAFVLVLYFLQFKKFKFDFNILPNIKYESSNIVSWLFLFATYFWGYSNAFSMGAEYIVAINFSTLITDAQWDAYQAISTATKIDIANKKYNHRKMVRQSLIYSLILIATSLVMFGALFSLYNLNIKFVIIFLSFQYADFLFSSLFTSFSDFYQLNCSATKNTILESLHQIIRFVLSAFLPTAFCTDIGQLGAGVFVGIIYIIIRFKTFKLDKNGNLIKKDNKRITFKKI